MPSKLSVLETLTAADVDRLEVYAREKLRSVDEIHEWLQAEGFTIGRTAAWNWHRKFQGRLLTERMSQSGELARAIMATAKESGSTGVTDAALTITAQVVFEQVSKLQADGEIESKDVVNWTSALKNLMSTKKDVESLKAEVDAALKDEMKAGGSAENVVNKVREILGIGN